MAFIKGNSGNPRGRPKGSLDKRTIEHRAFWKAFLESPEYRANAARRVQMGRAPHIESYLLQSIYGKPRDVVEQHGELTIRVESSE